MKRTYLSKEGYKKLKEELKYLKEVKKPEISKRIGVAREHGDLRENAEYDTAKEALAQVMIKIRDISMKLSTAEIIENTDIASDKVYIGASVHLVDQKSKEELKYILVSPDEVDVLEDKISVDSPIAKGLLGHKVGDTVEIRIPAGTVKYRITKIER
ncbi:MAG: transcription elongation factor GreA [Elusimicrobia bacterium]|nr:transcription elongation factor GreA [Elusimicrobiota bacterium]